jgi:hypothetical protein
LANPHKGEVEINLKKSIAAKIIQPANHGRVHLKYDMEMVGNVERDIRIETGMDISLFEMLDRNNKNPLKVSVYETAILLEYGLRDQFQGISRSLAYKILNTEDMGKVLASIMEALNIAFKGLVPQVEGTDSDGNTVEQPFVETAIEGVGEDAKK